MGNEINRKGKGITSYSWKERKQKTESVSKDLMVGKIVLTYLWTPVGIIRRLKSVTSKLEVSFGY